MTDKEKTSRRAAPETEKRQLEDEALETVWELAETTNEVFLAEVAREFQNEQAILGMVDDGLISIREGKVEFTEEGKARARDITRRHRLAERLFADVLELNEYELDACRLEHVISAEVEEAICTFLGHPPTCPHGKPIPRGRCCKLYSRKVTPLVVSLIDAEMGSELRVVFLRTPILDRLASIGLVAGSVIKLQQKHPSYVLKIDETTIAIEEEVARGIFVKRHES